jgi:predicted ATPase
MTTITNITLSGYKSIREMSLDLGPMNVLIGANGAGKSNLLSFLRLLYSIRHVRLRHVIATEGGANSVLFDGAKATREMRADITLRADENQLKYSLALTYAAPDALVITAESLTSLDVEGQVVWQSENLTTGRTETRLPEAVESSEMGKAAAELLLDMLGHLRVYHFNDTSPMARIRQTSYIGGGAELLEDGANLATLLYLIKAWDERAYGRIVSTIRMMLPWFEEFAFLPPAANPKSVLLNWRERNCDTVFGPHQLADGALRVMALVTLLSLPERLRPPIILIDEPELGLHPYAVTLLASMLRTAALHSQVIIATQSVSLLDHFEPEEIVVVDRDCRESVFQRLDTERLAEWIEEYSLGELWERNILGGGPL